MPKLSIDYSKCSMYKIEHIEKEDLIYIGQTTNFKQRKSGHKSSCRNNATNLYKIMRANGGWEMFRMIEIEKYPCKDRQEAEKREAELIRESRASMNTQHFFNEEEQRADDEKYEEYIRACKSNCFFSCFEDTLKWYIKIEIFKEVRIIKEQYKKIYDECMRELDFMT